MSSASRPHAYRSSLSHDGLSPLSSPRPPCLATPPPHASPGGPSSITTRPSMHGRRGLSTLGAPRPVVSPVRAAHGERFSPPLVRRGSPPPPPCKRTGKIRPLATHGLLASGAELNAASLQAKTRHLIPRIGLTGTSMSRWTASSRGANSLSMVTTTVTASSPGTASSHTFQAGKNNLVCTETTTSSSGRGTISSVLRASLATSSSTSTAACSTNSVSPSGRTNLSRTSPSPHPESQLPSRSNLSPTVSDRPPSPAGGLRQSSEEAQRSAVPTSCSTGIAPMRSGGAPTAPLITASSQINAKVVPCNPGPTPATTSNPVQSVNNFMRRLSRGKRKQTIVNKYCEEMNQLNEVANNRPRGALIHSIQQENRYIRELQEENKQLRLALEEQQNVMELIMSKYREQVAKLLSSGPDPHSADNTAMQRKLGANIERVSEMVCVMRRAAQLDEDQSQHFQQLVTALVRENKGLREMLHIAVQSGSVSSPERLDADTQTDPSTALDTDTIKLNPNFSASAATSATPGAQSCADDGKASSSGQAVAVSPTRQATSSSPAAAVAVDAPASPDRSGLEDTANKTVLESCSKPEQSSSDRVLLNNNQSDEDDEGRGASHEDAAAS